MELKQVMKGADLRFAVLSDVHITHRGQGLEKFTEAVMQLYRMDPLPEALVLAGDIAYQIDKAGGGKADQLYDEPYHMINAVLRRYVPTPVIYAIGNHEFGQGRHEEDITEDAIRMFRELGGHELCEHTVVKGYHFVTMGIDTPAGVYSPAMQDKMRAELEKALADGEEKPVFAVFHFPLSETVVCAKGGQHSAEFAAWIKSQPRIIAIVGHLHTPVTDPRTVYQEEGGFTTVHAPMCATGNCEVAGCDNHCHSGGGVSQGMFFEVRGNRVLMRKLDFMTKTEVDEPWDVNTEDLLRGEGYYYTNRRKEIANAPVFAKGTRISCRDLGGGTVSVEFAKAACEAAERSRDGFAEFYRFDFTADRSNAVCKSLLYCDDFYTLKPSDRFKDTLKTELPAGKYVIKITPVNPFGKEGEPITCKVRLR